MSDQRLGLSVVEEGAQSRSRSLSDDRTITIGNLKGPDALKEPEGLKLIEKS